MIALAFYGVAALYSIFLWRRGFRRDNRILYLLLLVGVGCNTLSMIKRGLWSGHCPVTTLYDANLFVTWTIGTTYLVVGLWRPLRFLGAFASPALCAISLFALIPGMDQIVKQTGTDAELGRIHGAIILMAYGAFGVSAIAALMYLTHEHNLKFNKLRALTALLPPLQRLDVVMWRALVVGFVLLTIGFTLGAGGLWHTKGVSFVSDAFRDASIIWSMFVWTLYLSLLILRWRMAHRRRGLAWWVIGSFCFVMLTFSSVYLLSPIHHPSPPAIHHS